MRQRIRLDTVTDIANFVLIASQVRSDVYLTNDNGLKVNGKSFLGVAHAHEFDN
jgi:phosphotransferase system HPr-like phosphotransfer protein